VETTSIIQGLRTGARPPAGRKKCTNQSKSKRPAGLSRNGFLTHRFDAFAGFSVNNWKQAEIEFFNSVTNVCRLYCLQEPDVRGLIFPQNVQNAYREINEFFDTRNDLNLKIMQDCEHDACLATLKTYDTGYRLYYIPVKPLYLLGSVEEQKPLAKLLITVYQYLYQVIGVNYYREPGYLNFTYETIENWIDEDEDGEDEDYRKYQRSEFEQMKIAGDGLLPILKKTFHIEMTELMLKEYRDCIDWYFDADVLVQEFVKLAKDYPGRSIKQSIPYNVYETGENDLICLEHYLSFYWSSLDGFRK
jgi:hypothetical protein